MYYGIVCSSLRICMKRNMLVNYNNNNNTTNKKKNSIEYEKQKMYLKSFIRQAFNHPYVHMLNHTDKVNDNHIKMQKNCISL